MMNLRWLTLGWCLAAALPAADLKLIPYPRSVATGSGELAIRAPFRIGVASASEQDHFAAGVLARDLREIAQAEATIGTATGNRPPVLIGRIGDRVIDSEIARRKLETSVLDKSESYLLSVTDAGALVAAKTDAGVFYGVETLRQLIRPGKGELLIPHVTIADWPALRYRGVSVDISRGPILTEEQMRSLIRNFAAYKLNILSFYIEHLFTYTHAPMVPPEGGEFTPELMKRLVDYARQYHVEIVPQQQTFGHLHHMLKLERYADMAEVPHGSVLAAESQQAYDWISQAAAQLAACTQSKFLHIGSDETAELGKGRSRQAAERDGVGNVYMAHMKKVAEMLRPLNRTLMFWGDIALNHAELIPSLPKDMVAMTWTYGPGEDFSRYTVPFRKAGLQFFVCPGVNNWSRIFPNLSDAVTNINNFVQDGKKYGALGMLNTEWADDGESLFNMTWHGIVFSAAAAWQEGTVDVNAFDRSFDWAFYRSDGGEFVGAIRELDQIHQLLRSAGVGDGNDELTWFDPFSSFGAERVRKILPVAAQIRKLAEDAWVRVSEHSAEARLNPDTLPLIRFAAKRFDYVGMRVQYAQQMAEEYRNQQPRGAASRATDLRDYTNELKEIYRTLWLAENRPCWIGNVLVRFDNEALYWVQKGRLFGAVAQEFRTTKSLPDPESLGLVLP